MKEGWKWDLRGQEISLGHLRHIQVIWKIIQYLNWLPAGETLLYEVDSTKPSAINFNKTTVEARLVVLTWIAMHAQTNKPIHKISHTFTYGVEVKSSAHTFMHAINIIYFLKIMIILIPPFSRVWKTKSQAIPGLFLYFLGRPWVPGYLQDVTVSVRSIWSSVSSSVYAAIRQYVCHPIWSLHQLMHMTTASSLSLLQSFSRCQLSPYYFSPFLVARGGSRRDIIILLPFILETPNCFRSLRVDRNIYVIHRAQCRMKMPAPRPKSVKNFKTAIEH